MARLTFGPFLLDTRAERLLREGVPVHLPPQAMATLAYLVRHAGALVTRGELRDHIWGDRIAEYDQGINFCVSQIRRALDDDASAPAYLETVPRRGYRFVHPVGGAGPGRRRAVRIAAAALVAFMVLAGALTVTTGGRPGVLVEETVGTDGRTAELGAALRTALAARRDVSLTEDQTRRAVWRFRVDVAEAGGSLEVSVLLHRGPDTVWRAGARGDDAEFAGLRDGLVRDAGRVLTDILSGTAGPAGETEVIRTGADVP